MKIGIFGLWHLGSVIAACLASIGHDITGLDFDEHIVSRLQEGYPPVFEPGLKNLLGEQLNQNRLRFTSKLSELPSNLELLWVTYDAPINTADEVDVDFMFAQIKAVLVNLTVHSTVLVSSQMPVGSIQKLEAMAQNMCPEKELSFAYSPENLQLGKALDRFLRPDRMVVGVRSDQDKERIAYMLQRITDQIEWMSVESAEMTKHAINAFLATSVVFANEIAVLCEQVGADAKEVERGLKSESRIGPKAYLSPGSAFTGGTLARDISYLKAAGKHHQIHIPLIESVSISNEYHKGWVFRALQKFFPSLDGIAVTIWGLTYKPGTDTLRRSLAVELGDWLIKEGAKVAVHDPIVKILPTHWHGHVQYFENALKALKGANVLVIGTEWPEYKDIASHVSEIASQLIILDSNRFLPSLSTLSFRYASVGMPMKNL